MKVLWTPTILPRTMTRREWRDLYRWKRVEEKKLRRMETAAIRAMFDRNEMLDRIANPPLLVHPLMEPKCPSDFFAKNAQKPLHEERQVEPPELHIVRHGYEADERPKPKASHGGGRPVSQV